MATKTKQRATPKRNNVVTLSAERDKQHALTQFRSLMDQELKTLETDELLARFRFARSIGSTFSGKRDLYQILGYEQILTVDQYRERYERGGIAGSVVDVMPNATWRGEFELIENEHKLVQQEYTNFEKMWKSLSDRLTIPNTFLKVDVLSRLSTFAVLLIGAPGNLSTPLPFGPGNPDGIAYFQPFIGGGGWRMSGIMPSRNNFRSSTSDAGADAVVKTYVTDAKDPRFGQPELYTLKRTNFSTPSLNEDVHWSRIIHIAEDTLDDDVFGRPALARCWNLFDDLGKVSGGGAEAFWLRANRGIQIDVDKEIKTLKPEEKEDLKDQVERYVHEMTRVLRTRGVTIKELGSDVANFSNPGDFIVSLIAGSARVPKRILLGSEMGELASTQDRENFRDTVSGRQTSYCGPMMVRRLANRLIKYKWLPEPAQYMVRWPKAEILTEDERASGALKWAQINSACAQASLPPAFTIEEIRDKWYGMLPIPEDVLKKLLSIVPKPVAALPVGTTPTDGKNPLPPKPRTPKAGRVVIK